MLEIKEIQYFVACVQTGSFSKAAEKLFTTQSNVSKVIRAMEEEIDTVLFERLAKGIRMTPEAQRIYPCALGVLENMEKMQKTEEKTVQTLSISCNPSSWFADRFAEFYGQRKEEEIHYQIHSANSREIVERVRERAADIGFVYIMKNQLAAFQYYIFRNYLEFTPLKETDAVLYRGRKGKEKETDFSRMKLIQRFPDEFSADNYWNILDENGQAAEAAETVITTNSDYIMERVLQYGDLVNISGGYLSGKPQREIAAGEKLALPDGRILFGYVKRKGEELSGMAEEFLTFLVKKLEE